MARKAKGATPKQPTKLTKEKAERKAKSAKAIAKTPGIKHNSKAQTEIIASASAQMARIEKQMEDLNLQKKEQRQRVKAAGVKLKAFDFARTLKKMEGGESVALIEDIQTAGRAIGLGEQLQLFADERRQGDQLEKDRKDLREVSAPNGAPAKPGELKPPKTLKAATPAPAPAKDLLQESF